ncbi:MAG: tetratricopeptide repeat protein [Vicinamibacterales bacterium]
MTRRTWGLVLACFALTAGLGLVLVRAQSGGAASPQAAAEQAWRTGEFDTLDTLAAGSDNPSITILRARSLIVRGDYAGAEALLAPLASQNPAGDAGLELGLLQTYLGRQSEARRSLQMMLLAAQDADSARELLRAGRAARAMGRFEDANGYFRDAVALAPDDVEINTAWGELFLEKYNRKDALRSFQDALKADEDYGPALVGMARTLEDDNPPEATKFAARALTINPRNLDAQLFMAERAIGQDRKDEARDLLAKVREVNPRRLEAIALQAALAYVVGDTEYQALAAEALAINPTYGELYRVVGSVTAGYYRFDEAAEQTRRAIQLDRDNWRAYASSART